MNILITGGAGFIGSQLGFYLLSKGHKVTLVDNLQFGYLENLVKGEIIFPHFFSVDIRSPELESFMTDIDVVFHLAGISSLPECNYNVYDSYSTNTAGTANVLELSRRKGVKRVVFSSTSAVYENNETFPLAESDTIDPLLIYSLSKKHAEDLCHSYIQMYGMDICILRFFNVYGPHMDYTRANPPLVSYIIKCLLLGQTPILHSNGKQKRDMIYIDDVLNMCEIVLSHTNAGGNTFNVGTGQASSVQEIYSIINNEFRGSGMSPVYRDPLLLWEKYKGLYEGKYPMKPEFLINEVNKYTLASAQKSKKILGWEAKVSLEEGLKKTVTYVTQDYKKRVLLSK